ncbi:DUF4062 domain-containing protein [Halarcobacter sp.]|uniref:DUF4062 domain-containing protein n=1 Tax=Halarcobacter sp. TaxID=2321133 RepID=UPI002AAC1606|nr:DUF4062 domain-containing protein [Halarcobacter sp.]
MDTKRINVFIASPGDLTDERNELNDVINRINKTIGRRFNIVLDLHGWEDTSPGYNRPQAQINKDLENCDLFIGVVWKRWGSPSGEYDSGFFEEFTIAKNKKESNELIDLWLYFKNVEQNLINDPGQQLSKVLEFKKKQIEDKKLLFKNFDDTNEFSKLIHDNLTSFLMDIDAKDNDANKQKIDKPLEINDNDFLKDDSDSLDESSKNELIEIYNSVTQKIKDKKESEIDSFTSLRLYISSLALFSSRHYGELLNTHQFNSLYVKRDKFNFTTKEYYFIIRSFVGNLDNNISGWYWLKDMLNKEGMIFLMSMALYDKNKSSQIGALKILKLVKFIPKFEFLEKLFTSDNEDKLLATLDLSYNSNEKSIMNLLEKFLNYESNNVKQKALSLYCEKLYNYDKVSSFIFMTENCEIVPKFFRDLVNNNKFDINLDTLLSYGLNSSSKIRLFTVEYLEKKEKITDELSDELLHDIDSNIRKIGFLYKLNEGYDFSLKEVSDLFPEPKKENKTGLLSIGFNSEVTENEMIPYVLKRKSKDDLYKLLDFVSFKGSLIYRAYVECEDEDMIEIIRKDLEDNFEESRKQFLKGYEEIFYEGISDELKIFLENKHIVAAFYGLLKYGKKSDIKYVKKYIGQLKYNDDFEPVVLLIEKFGQKTEIKDLYFIQNKLYGDLREKALELIIYFSDDKKKVIKEFLEKNDFIFLKVALNSLKILEVKKIIKILKDLLFSDFDNIRNKSIEMLFKYLTIEESIELLNEYISSETYYYSVSNKLDILIYGKDLYGNSVELY